MVRGRVVAEDLALDLLAAVLAADDDDAAVVGERGAGGVGPRGGEAGDPGPLVLQRVEHVDLGLGDLSLNLPVLPADRVELAADGGGGDVVAGVGHVGLALPAGVGVVQVQGPGGALLGVAGLVHAAGKVEGPADQGGGPGAAGLGQVGAARPGVVGRVVLPDVGRGG